MKYLILYKTARIELIDKIDKTLMRLIEGGVINFIYDCDKDILIALNENSEVTNTPMNIIKTVEDKPKEKK